VSSTPSHYFQHVTREGSPETVGRGWLCGRVRERGLCRCGRWMVGPRHRGYVPRRVTRGDVAEVQALLKDASSYTKKVRREIRDLRAFMELNQFARGTPHTKVLALFAVQYLDGERRSATTLEGILQDFDRFHVDPFNLAAAEHRVYRQHLRNAIKRRAKMARRRWIRKPLISGLFPDERPANRQERDRWAFWALVVVTGNRPNNVLRAKTVVCDHESVTVGWGLRKVHSNIEVLYKFSWSETPPVWIRQRWNALRTRAWPFPKPETVASAVNQWLKRWNFPVGVTSTSPRGSLDHVLRGVVESRSMTKEIYARTIDHKYETGLDNYSSVPVNAEV
jgi:hypothetical protein